MMSRPPECICKSTHLGSEEPVEVLCVSLSSVSIQLQRHAGWGEARTPASASCAIPHSQLWCTIRASRTTHYILARPWSSKSTVMAGCQTESHVWPYIIITGPYVHSGERFGRRRSSRESPTPWLPLEVSFSYIRHGRSRVRILITVSFPYCDFGAMTTVSAMNITSKQA